MEGSIKAAAEKLHVSQPTISDQIKLLEGYFRCKLFERKNRSLVLTHDGRMALAYAEKIFNLASEVTGKLRNPSYRPKTSVDIGVTYLMGHYFLYDTIMPLFQEENISVNIRQGQRHHLFADLEEDKVDIVFTDSIENMTPNMQCFKVGVNRTYAVAHKKYKKTKEKFPECLNQIPFLNYTKESFFKYEIELFFVKHSLTPKLLGEADDIDLMYKITESGKGFTIVPEVAAKRFLLNKDIITLGELADLQTTVWALVKNNYHGPLLGLLKK